MPCDTPHIGYVLKRFPRYSETFIVNELLALEAAGWRIEIFSLYPPNETHCQSTVSRLRAPVHYFSASVTELLACDLWLAMRETAEELPMVWQTLARAPHANAREVYQALLVARATRRLHINHLHAHFATTSTTVAQLAARIAGVTYSFTAHAKDIFHKKVRYGDLREKLEGAAAVVTVSDYNVRFLQACCGPSAARVERIYNGLSLEWFEFEEPHSRPPLILAVGRLVAKKGFADLIDACAHLAARRINFRCEIIGTGPLERELSERVQQLDLSGRVLLAGPRPQAEVFDRVRKAAVMAAPCIVAEDGDRDGLPTTILEAMAVGTPVVATAVTGIPEVIRADETGLLVPVHDPVSLADALERLLANSALRIELARGARRLIELEFDARRTSEQLQQVFRRVAQVHPALQEAG